MGRKILLVEDDRETAAYLSKGLTQEGHSVEQAGNGQDGLFRATDGSFDLIILDRMLLEQVWDYHFDPGTNVIDVHVSRLRRKLDEGFEKPLLHTVRGAGYMLAA